MATVDPVFVQWLTANALWHVVSDAALEAKWAELAVTTERLTPLALKSDATAEGERQVAFLGGPLAVDTHLLAGEWRGYIGRVITLTIGHLDYDEGEDVFLIGAEDDLARGLSTVTVLRQL
jgi:hypothetical protein